MVKIRELRKTTCSRLYSLGNSDALADIDFMLINLLGLDKSQIILGDRDLTDDELEIFKSAVLRLENGEPVQYICGKCEFMSLEFMVNHSTLIPRPDTEISVEKVIELAKGQSGMRILDIGCGSGCIGISLAHYLENATVCALDISPDALSVAEKNAKNLGVSDRMEFFRHDILSAPFDRESDIVISNPPYIPSSDILTLERKVRDFEPTSALDGGDDGLMFYRKIAETVILSPNGYLVFEVGINQSHSVRKIMEKRFCDIEITHDLSGIERTVSGRLKS